MLWPLSAVPWPRGVRAAFSLGLPEDFALTPAGQRRSPEAWRALEHCLGARGVRNLQQVHSATLHWVESLSREDAVRVGDGLWARAGDPAVAVLTADCLPVLLANAKGTCVAAVHAGWRGLAGGILEAAAAGLADGVTGLEGSMAWLGPCIGPASFEVGGEVVQALGAGPAGSVRPGAEGKAWVDLAALARARLLAAGIAEVFVDGRDVFCLESAYSHRRQGAGAGRQVAAIVPRPAC